MKSEHMREAEIEQLRRQQHHLREELGELDLELQLSVSTDIERAMYYRRIERIESQIHNLQCRIEAVMLGTNLRLVD